MSHSLKAPLCLASAFLALAACSKDDDDGNAGTPAVGANRTLDTSNFKNNADSATLNTKMSAANGVFKDVSGLKGSFNVVDSVMRKKSILFSAVAPRNPDLDDGTETETDAGDGVEIGSEDMGAPKIGNITDCSKAFEEFADSYEQSERSFRQMLSTLQNIDAKASEDGFTLKKVTPDATAAVAYEIVPNTDPNAAFSMKGKIQGGANGNLLVLKSDYELKMDLSKLGQGTPTTPPTDMDPEGSQAPALNAAAPGTGYSADNPPPGPLSIAQKLEAKAEIAKKIIETDITAKLTVGGSQPSSFSMTAFTSVQGGEKPMAAFEAQFTGTGAQAATGSYALKMAKLDENTLSFSMTAGDGTGVGAMSFKLVRSSGTCAVKELVNTLPTGFKG